jgi:hypothetical protein
MDCCRPDLRDLTDEQAQELNRAWQREPALHRYWLAVRAWDAALSDALARTPVPDGLQDQLLAAVRTAAPAPGEPAAAAARDADVRRPAPESPRVRARRWATAVAASLLATSAVLALALWFAWPRDTLTAAQVVDDARNWLAHLDTDAWRTSAPPVDTFPLDGTLRAELVGWQPCATLPGADSMAYQASIPPDRTAAVLFVVRSRLGRQLPALPPTTPDATTGNLCIGVWKADGFLYVLVVPGRDSNYRQALVTPAFA